MRSPSTSFLGRERELEQLHDQLSHRERWLITVHGPGGTGKTRFARRYGELHLERGSWFCDLTDVRDGAGICEAMAGALGVSLGNVTSADAVACVGNALLALGPILVIVDNCEHLTSDIGLVLSALHDAAPTVQFLATSRELLRVRGEWVHELGALPSAEAERLFMDRACMVRHDFQPSEAESRAVASIVRRLEGLPLAIELAAARMGMLDAQAILDRLQDNFDLLSGGARDVAARQRTLRDTIEWSWRLLAPWEQAALAQCAVFHGGFTLAAAEATLDVSGFAAAPPIIDVVQALCDKSLLRIDDGTGGRRIAMYESVRAFAVEKFERQDFSRSTYDRHAAHYVKQADEIVRAFEQRDLDEVRRHAIELENLRAVHARALSRKDAAGRHDALRAMVGLDALLRERGPRDVHRTLLASTIDACAGGSADRRLFGRVTLAYAQLRGHEPDAFADAERALAIGREERDAWLEASGHVWFGHFESWAGRYGAASERFSRARERFAEGGYRSWEATMIVNMAASAIEAGYTAETHAHCEESLAALRRLGDLGGVALMLFQMGHGLHDVGRLDEAYEMFAEMLPFSHHIATRDRGCIFGYVATLHHELGDMDEARRWYERALALLRSVGVGGPRYEQLFSAALGALEATEDDVLAAKEAFARVTELNGTDVMSGALRVHRGHFDLAQARACTARGDARGSARNRARAEARLRDAGSDATDDLRFATRMLQRALERPKGAGCVVAADGRWFRPHGQRKVDLARRPQLIRILSALVQSHLTAPREPLSVAALFRAAWPNERVAVQRAGAMRVYVQLSRLRRLGLRDALRTSGDGYSLAPDTVVDNGTP